MTDPALLAKKLALVHGYDDVDLVVVRDILEHHLADLVLFVAHIRARL